MIVRAADNQVFLRREGKEPFMDAAMISAAILAAQPGPSFRALRERKNIQTMPAAELADYRYALERLMRSTDVKGNYEYYANLHNQFTATCDTAASTGMTFSCRGTVPAV